jgi:glycosyltransferase involved in cell wall biosynthesis
MGDTRVSVVVPTRNRPSLVVAAVTSALNQTLPPHEVVVVVDGPDDASVEALHALHAPQIRVHVHQRSRGAGAARNTGVRLAEGGLVAFLDDDDRWLPAKLERQVAHWAAAADNERLLVSCQSRFITGGRPSEWPTRRPREGERLADYLFVRNHAGEGALPTPTFLLSRNVATAYPMPEHLDTHEEWDWLLDLERTGVRVEVVMETLAVIDAAPRRRSVSGSSSWRASLAWADERSDDLGRRAFSAFVLTEVARGAALQGWAPGEQRAILAAALTGRPRPRDLARFAGRPLVLAARRLGKERR